VEAVRRGAWLFLLNHADAPARVCAGGVDVLTGREHAREVEVEPGGVVVLRERGT
jgi:beta-galactosidase